MRDLPLPLQQPCWTDTDDGNADCTPAHSFVYNSSSVTNAPGLASASNLTQYLVWSWQGWPSRQSHIIIGLRSVRLDGHHAGIYLGQPALLVYRFLEGCVPPERQQAAVRKLSFSPVPLQQYLVCRLGPERPSLAKLRHANSMGTAAGRHSRNIGYTLCRLATPYLDALLLLDTQSLVGLHRAL